jgi:MraZ protein
VFSGWSIHTLDAKGRLAIPARFRDVLRARRDERLVITTSDRCLACYPYEEWRAMADKVSRLSQVDPRVQAFRRYFISAANECICDKQGRVLIPQALREMAVLNGQVLLVGMQNNFEIWDKDRWYQERDNIRQNFGDLSSFMAELGV